MSNIILPDEISTPEKFVNTVEGFYNDSDRITKIVYKPPYIVFVTVLDGKHIRCYFIPNDNTFKEKITIAFEEFAEEPYTDVDYRDFVKDFIWTF